MQSRRRVAAKAVPRFQHPPPAADVTPLPSRGVRHRVCNVYRLEHHPNSRAYRGRGGAVLVRRFCHHATKADERRTDSGMWAHDRGRLRFPLWLSASRLVIAATKLAPFLGFCFSRCAVCRALLVVIALRFRQLSFTSANATASRATSKGSTIECDTSATVWNYRALEPWAHASRVVWPASRRMGGACLVGWGVRSGGIPL